MQSIVGKLGSSLFGPLGPTLHSSLIKAQLSCSPALFNCPTHRRTVEKRAKRRFGVKEWGTWRIPVVNKKIRVDHETGEYYELGKLAPGKYKKVMAETRLIQLGMMEKFGSDPKDKEVCVVYEGEEEDADKLIVERKRERPQWFSRSQLERVREEPTGGYGTVRPSGLG